MPISLRDSRPSVLIRRTAFERKNLSRQDVDSRFNLTDEEFHVEGDLIVIGPLPSDEMVVEMIAELEASGLAYFDDFFELSGNWPEWVRVYVGAGGA